jgi:hypothetical protein
MLTTREFFNTPASQLTSEMEEVFFTSLMTSNKTYKTTFHGRFADINKYLRDELGSGRMRAIRILDIGISSGISTLELYEDLWLREHTAEVVGTDILIDALLVRVYPGCDAVVDTSGFPLRFDVLGRGMAPWIRHTDYRSGFFLIRKAINVALTRRAKCMLSRSHDPRVERIELVTPRLLAHHDITVCADDISQYNPGFANRFDFIRVANVLNEGYFPEATLRTMIGNIKKYLAGDGSSLLIVRTHEDRVNHGTLFRATDGQHFEAKKRFGAGSEIENLVLQS